MNVENYRRFLEAIGHQVVASATGYWFDIRRSFYESIPPVSLITPDDAEVKTLIRRHRMIGLKYCAPCDHTGKQSWIYVCQDHDYDLGHVHRKMRNKVRQGLESCTVHPISFDFLCERGMPPNRDTLERQGRDDPLFTNPDQWAALCQAGREIEGSNAWGAFVGDQLAAYMITFTIDGYSNILYQMSRTDLLGSHANNALAFVATQEMLTSPHIQAISYGQASIRELPGLEEFKTRLGYQKRPMRYVIVLNPLIRYAVLNWASGTLLRSLARIAPDHDFLRQLNGMLDIAKQSQQMRPAQA